MNLTICQDCRLNSVVPLLDECSQTPKGWHVVLRCTACCLVTERTITQDQAMDFDDHLDDQRRELVKALEKLERLNAKDERKRFKKEAARFIRAIQGGHILPMDFH